MSQKRVIPYLPAGRKMEYVSAENPHIQAAKQVAMRDSLDPNHPTGAVLVLHGKIIGQGANGSAIHQRLGCIRKRLQVKTGQHYWLCRGCHPHNHAEQKAIKNTVQNEHKTEGADIYLWGHWWCCQSCWNAIIGAGIKSVFLSKDEQ